MKTTLGLSFLLLLSVALGCTGTDASGPAGTGGAGGDGGMDGGAGEGGDAGSGGEGGTGGIILGNCHSSVPDRLSQWGLFKNIRDQDPEDDVAPFTVTSPLFTDYALKPRFVTLRGGGRIHYTDPERWQSPVGTIYVKTFAYPPNKLADPPQTEDQLIETRLLVHDAAEDDRLGCLGAESCWNTHVYVYNEDQTDAICESGGLTKSVTFTKPLTDEQVTIDDYHVPVSPGECGQCHGPRGPSARTLGPSTGMLNRGNDYQGNVVENQVDELDDAGWLDSEPPPFDMRTTYSNPVELIARCTTPACYHEAARSFLDSNCAHCHAPDGEERAQGLFVDYTTMDPTGAGLAEFDAWGVCVTPTSAGGLTPACNNKQVDIWPGEPDKSLLLCRLESVIPGEMMPTLGRSVQDTESIAIIRRWIIDLPMLFPSLSVLYDLDACRQVIP